LIDLQTRLKKYENNDAVKDLLQEIDTKIKINQVYVDHEAQMKKEIDENLRKENDENPILIEENKQDISSRLATYNKYTDKGNNL
jgi:hypothetical protein